MNKDVTLESPREELILEDQHQFLNQTKWMINRAEAKLLLLQ